MLSGSGFPVSFFARPCRAVARDLIGAILVRRLPRGARLAGRIVEVEAYLGDGSDPGSHSHRGPTPRNRAMFGPPGRWYVYRSYGIHACLNVVCEPRGRGAAVLIRAVEPLAGEDRMRTLRGLPEAGPPRLVAGGPGRLTQAFGICLTEDGASAVRGILTLRRPPPRTLRPRIATSHRIGLTKAANLPYRYLDAASACLSRPA